MTGDRDSRLSGDDLRAMFASAAALLERNMESVNALNVFPVPDGDTGTNMFLTLQAVVEGAGPPDGAPASDVASSMARAALMGARGNSGVILSQLFKGIETGSTAPSTAARRSWPRPTPALATSPTSRSPSRWKARC